MHQLVHLTNYLKLYYSNYSGTPNFRWTQTPQ
jgi:hypothetical protein